MTDVEERAHGILIAPDGIHQVALSHIDHAINDPADDYHLESGDAIYSNLVARDCAQ